MGNWLDKDQLQQQERMRHDEQSESLVRMQPITLRQDLQTNSAISDKVQILRLGHSERFHVDNRFSSAGRLVVFLYIFFPTATLWYHTNNIQSI
jgi:hypothetical protein